MKIEWVISQYCTLNMMVNEKMYYLKMFGNINFPHDICFSMSFDMYQEVY